MYIDQNLPQCKHDVSSLPVGDYERAVVTNLLGRRKVTVACVYIHRVRSWTVMCILEELRALIKGSLIVCEDFIAHNSIWGSISSCKRSRKLAAEIKSAELVVVGNGSLTFLRSHSTTSVIDITLHTPDMPLSWRTAHDTEGGTAFLST